MTHDEIQDLLGDYVDERLAREVRRTVDAHLATCAECRSILDGVAPVDLGDFAMPAWDAASMRRLIRRSFLRTAVNVAVLFLALWLVALLVSAIVLQPLVVDRGGRAQAATVATADVAIMFNPGTAVDEYEFASGFLSRRSSVRLVRPVGTSLVTVGTVDSSLGLRGFGADDGGALMPFIGDASGGSSDVAAHLDALGDATVATVEIFWNEPIPIAEAQELTDGPHDTRVVWAGFNIGQPATTRAEGGLASWVSATGLGYATCGGTPLGEGFFGGGGGSGGASVFMGPASVQSAYLETIRSLENLIAHPDIAGGILGIDVTDAEFAAAADVLRSNAEVRSLVVTGPTPELRSFIDDAQPSFGAVRDIDFANWFSPICGR